VRARETVDFAGGAQDNLPVDVEREFESLLDVRTEAAIDELALERDLLGPRRLAVSGLAKAFGSILLRGKGRPKR
jgi:hypothetical protein